MSQCPVIRILIADDHPMVRAGLVAIIQSHKEMCLVGEASNGCEAVSLYRLHQPDVVVQVADRTQAAITAIQRGLVRTSLRDFTNY